MKLIAVWGVLLAGIALAGAPGPWNSGRAPAWAGDGDCASCHAAEAEFIAHTKHNGHATCADCHPNAHRERERHEPPIGRTNEDMRTCRNCHQNDLSHTKTISRSLTGAGGREIGFSFSHEKHAQSLGYDCQSCHSGSIATPNPINCASCHIDAIHGARDRTEIPPRGEVYPGHPGYTRCSPRGLARCGACHHGSAVEKGIQHADGRWRTIPNMTHHDSLTGFIVRSCTACHPSLK